MSLADSLERAASALPGQADQIRPANGDPIQLLDLVDAAGQQELLRWLLVNEPDAANELCLEWIECEGAEQILGGIDEAALPKPGRKVLHRAQHRLRSRGVKLAARPRESVVSRLPQIEENVECAYITPIDRSGARMLFLVEPNPSGGLRLFELVLDELRGVVDGEVYAAGRSKVRRFVRELARGHKDEIGPVEVEPRAARTLIARIAAGHPSDRPFPRAFSEWRSHLVRDDGETPGELAEGSLSPGDEAAGVSRAVELIERGELGPWPPARERLSNAASQLEQQSEGQVILSEVAERERVDAALAAIAVEFFADGFMDLTADRLREMAYPLWKAGRADDARACLAAAASLRTESVDTSRVARALLEACLSPVLDAIRAKMGQDGSSDATPEASPDEGEGDT